MLVNYISEDRKNHSLRDYKAGAGASLEPAQGIDERGLSLGPLVLHLDDRGGAARDDRRPGNVVQLTQIGRASCRERV